VQHPAELLPVSPLVPRLVVEVLAAAFVVDPDGLEVTVGITADPHVGPSRGNDKGPDPGQRVLVVNRATGGVDVAKPATAALTGVSRFVAADPTEPGHGLALP
jgi:hypothetical protein